MEARDNLVIYDAMMLLYANTFLLNFVSTLNTINYGYQGKNSCMEIHCSVILTFFNCAVQSQI